MNAVMLVGIGGLALLLFSSKSNAATATGTPPSSVLERLKAALASGNPATIRATAAQLRLEGYPTQAAQLERAAVQLEALPNAPTTGGVLKRGSTGNDVRSWQTFLRAQGYANVEIDGVFGVQTEDATKAFQRTKGLTPDGIVGPDTLRASQTLPPAAAATAPTPAPKPPTPTVAPTAVAAPAYLKRGSTGPDVVAWQTFLRYSQGYTTVTIDGVFGIQTEDGTKAFQRSRSLVADGIVGPDTLKASKMPAPAPAPVVVTSAGIAGSAPSTIKLTLPAPAPAPVVVAAKQPTIIAAPAPAPLPAAARLLSKGTSGSDVLAWQTFLRAQGYTAVALDGVFGVQTEDATKAFQRARGITADGIVGPTTLKAATTLAPAVAATAAAVTAAVAKAPVAAAVAAAITTITASAWRVLKRGASGTDVREWQSVLKLAGYAVAVDGVFGAETEAATKAWQAARKLVADGIVGAGSVASLRAAPPVNVKVAGDFAMASPLPGIIPDAAPPLVDVSADQSLAAQLALHLTTSIPGSEDRALVEQFQRVLGLNPTGAYGPGTARALMRYGILPPKPFYWPSQQSQREKANYRQSLLRQAALDPVRAREWNAAASRV